MALLILAGVILLSLILIVLGLPGLWIMVASAVAYNMLVPGDPIGWFTLIAVTVLGVIAEVLEFTISGKYARKYGGSRRAGWCAIVGGMVGAVVGFPVPIVGPVIGAFVGSFIGALAAELSIGAGARNATRAGYGALIGRVVSTVLKIGIGFAIIDLRSNGLTFDPTTVISEMEGSTRPATAPGATGEGKYVYCIIRLDRSRDFGEIGIGGGARVYTINHNDLGAVVSDTPIVIYDPTRENVLAHEFVNETVMREFTLIPMSFGTVFRSEKDVAVLLKSTYQAFTDVLEKMQDKIEFGLKILWDRDKVVASIERDNDEIRRLKDEITRNAASSTYFARMQLGRLVEAAMEEASNRYVAHVHDELKDVSVASRSNKVIGDRMILNAAFLVERKDEKSFDEKVKAISLKFDDLLTFKYTGPWPPYNFVNIKLKLEKAT